MQPIGEFVKLLDEGRVRGLIFDMDGTILDSMHLWRELKVDYLRELGALLSREDLAILNKPMSVKRFARYAHDKLGCTGDLEQELTARISRGYACDVREKPHVEEFLKAMAARGVKMCVATATPTADAQRALDRLKLTGYFEFILTCSMVGANKHSPAIYHEAIRRLALPAEEIAVFEDALYCVKTVRLANLRLVGVQDRHSAEDEDEIRALCDFYIDSYQLLIK